MTNEKCEKVSEKAVKKVTLKMIADAAGVSISCVTRCINHTGYVSEKKREKVFRIMNDLNYIPNQQAKCLRGGQSKLLGYIYLASAENIFFSKIATAVERVSFEKGYTIISFALNGVHPHKLKEILTLLSSYGVDGVLFNTGIDAELEVEIAKAVRQISVPVVMIERVMDVYEVEKVLVDNAEGSYIATNKLFSAGHTRIAYLGVVQDHVVEVERYDGYVQAMKKIDPEYAQEHSWFVEAYSVKNGYQKCLEKLKDSDEQTRPTAIFAASDILAAGVYRALMDLNIKIPDDISLVGYDDTIAEFMSPPLSTMQLPMEEIADAALDILIDKIEKRTNYVGNRTVKIGPVFIGRESIRELLPDER